MTGLLLISLSCAPALTSPCPCADIPVAVVLSKVDKACEETARDLSKVFLSVRIEESVDAVAEKLGIQRSYILPVRPSPMVLFPGWRI
jgi:hypothetical protein